MNRIDFNKVFIISVNSEYFCGKVEQALNMKLGIDSSQIFTFEDIYKNSKCILDIDKLGTYLIIYDPEFINSRDESDAWREIESKIRSCAFHFLRPAPPEEWKDGEPEIYMRVYVYNNDGTAANLDFKEEKVINKYPEIYEDLKEVVAAIDWRRENMTDFWPYTKKY